MNAPLDGPVHLRFHVRPRKILIILRLESFGVIFFNNLSIPLHFPFLPSCFPTHTLTSLPLRHSKRMDMRRSRINISLAAIMQPSFCSSAEWIIRSRQWLDNLWSVVQWHETEIAGEMITYALIFWREMD